jgi:hypothetical protein
VCDELLKRPLKGILPEVIYTCFTPALHLLYTC